MIAENDIRELKKRFTYHPPKDGQRERYENLRAVAFELAECIMEQAPDSREKAIAITKVEEAVMWTNAAIARNE